MTPFRPPRAPGGAPFADPPPVGAAPGTDERLFDALPRPRFGHPPQRRRRLLAVPVPTRQPVDGPADGGGATAAAVEGFDRAGDGGRRSMPSQRGQRRRAAAREAFAWRQPAEEGRGGGLGVAAAAAAAVAAAAVGADPHSPPVAKRGMGADTTLRGAAPLAWRGACPGGSPGGCRWPPTVPANDCGATPQEERAAAAVTWHRQGSSGTHQTTSHLPRLRGGVEEEQ